MNHKTPLHAKQKKSSRTIRKGRTKRTEIFLGHGPLSRLSMSKFSPSTTGETVTQNSAQDSTRKAKKVAGGKQSSWNSWFQHGHLDELLGKLGHTSQRLVCKSRWLRKLASEASQQHPLKLNKWISGILPDTAAREIPEKMRPVCTKPSSVPERNENKRVIPTDMTCFARCLEREKNWKRSKTEREAENINVN